MPTRRREVTDDAIFRAVERVVRRKGPSFTLGDVGREAKLSAPRLVQRFGSRGRLLETTIQRWAVHSLGALEALAQSDRPLANWIRYTRAQSTAITPNQAFNSLGWIQIQRTDPSLARQQRRFFEQTEAVFTRIVEAAISRGELAKVDAEALAHRLILLTMGNLVWLAMKGKAEWGETVGDLIEAEVAPYRTERARD